MLLENYLNFIHQIHYYYIVKRPPNLYYFKQYIYIKFDSIMILMSYIKNYNSITRFIWFAFSYSNNNNNRAASNCNCKTVVKKIDNI